MVINLGLHTMQLPEKHTSHSHLALHTQCFFHKPCAGTPTPWLLYGQAASSQSLLYRLSPCTKQCEQGPCPKYPFEMGWSCCLRDTGKRPASPRDLLCTCSPGQAQGKQLQQKSVIPWTLFPLKSTTWSKSS